MASLSFDSHGSINGCIIQDTIDTFSADCWLPITNRRSCSSSNAPSIISRAELRPKIGFGPRAQTHMGCVCMSVWYGCFDGERSIVHIAWPSKQGSNGLSFE